MIKNYIKRMISTEKIPPRRPHHKIVWSWLGAFVSIYLIANIHNFIDIDALSSLFLVGSLGASAVLIYGTPNAEFAQPRNLVGGHIVSAFIGISVYKYISFDIELLSVLAVSLSVVAMHYTRTLHPHQVEQLP